MSKIAALAQSQANRMPLRVVIKAPRGARGSLHQESGVFALEAVTLAHSPFGWATVPKTLGEDGEPMDAVVLGAGPTVPGELIAGEVLGGLMVQLVERDQHRPERSERMVLVISAAPEHQPLSSNARGRLLSFVIASAESAGKCLLSGDWEDGSYAADAVLRASAAFQRQRA